ncbi:hypothetical protein LOZ57_003769 [Ophidiomyces ophidiicola]|uniref:uncharacterized protein n=1 Tax=Ophidiomyces ophidiicola TaxID=1387563 RepID=UPI0020C445BB|nr:uncharacterized protein LOZ57_003769 [Ophidiomyces ophidiicola]KAI1946514.1 hypothetical protein LOZ57_003769 [Ophidiomyces ophidiicola]KAI2048351.1 hypothetical protein LOZ43_005406 [Ophidiomyces ophidiicola]
MVERIPGPDPRALLPPLLACLPVGFASPQPPPALLPLLSPVLRQRIQLLSSVSPSLSESWIRLLCWDVAKGAEIERIVGEASFEPHPISGEIDIPDDIETRYKRIDHETLRASLLLTVYNLATIYVWCPNDQEPGGSGWKVTEVLPLDLFKHETDSWKTSIAEANDDFPNVTLRGKLAGRVNPSNEHSGLRHDENEQDDDEYWAQYDDNLGRTPVRKHSPAPDRYHTGALKSIDTTLDSLYYSRYDGVQPALDSDDPSVDRNELGDSSFSNEAVANILRQHMTRLARQGEQPSTPPGTIDPTLALNHPRPSSASSDGSAAVLKLEQSAESQSLSQVGVREHISCQITSLYRLAKCTGISGEEFAGFVQNELESLGIADRPSQF